MAELNRPHADLESPATFVDSPNVPRESGVLERHSAEAAQPTPSVRPSARPSHWPTMAADPHTPVHPASFATLTLAAVGVVYGDIGTSPLYALKECLSPHYGLAATRDNLM